MIELGRRLGRTADEVGRTMSAAELTRQRVYDEMVAAEKYRADKRAAEEADRQRRRR